MADITSPASDPRSLRRHYPHQVQGVSTPAVAGPDSQPLRLPRSLLLGQNRTRICEVNGSDRCVACELPCSRRGCHYSGPNRQRRACSETADEILSRGLRSRFFFHVRVKDGLPLTFYHPPDRTVIIGAGRVLAFRRGLNLRLITNDGGARIRKDDIEIAQVKRLHLRLCHCVQFFLQG